MSTTELRAALERPDFTAIDIEIANEQYDSLCAIGIVRVEKGMIRERISYRVRPRKLRVSVIHQQVHKLTERDLMNEPELVDIWPLIEPHVVGQILVAHNASFDIDVLRRSLAAYGIRFPMTKYLCSLKLAAKAFPGLDSYRLKDLAASFDIPLVHHDALSDARACATITAVSLPRIDLSSLAWRADELTSYLEKIASRVRTDPWTELFGHKDFDSQLLKPNLDVENKDNPFYNKKVVFTGDLESMKRAVAAQMIQALGADINVAISKRTNLVIVGRAPGPSKMRKVDEFRRAGHDIRIMLEPEFWS